MNFNFLSKDSMVFFSKIFALNTLLTGKIQRKKDIKLLFSHDIFKESYFSTFQVQLMQEEGRNFDSEAIKQLLQAVSRFEVGHVSSIYNMVLYNHLLSSTCPSIPPKLTTWIYIRHLDEISRNGVIC